jgi:hypothetical protein
MLNPTNIGSAIQAIVNVLMGSFISQSRCFLRSDDAVLASSPAFFQDDAAKSHRIVANKQAANTGMLSGEKVLKHL